MSVPVLITSFPEPPKTRSLPAPELTLIIPSLSALMASLSFPVLIVVVPVQPVMFIMFSPAPAFIVTAE